MKIRVAPKTVMRSVMAGVAALAFAGCASVPAPSAGVPAAPTAALSGDIFWWYVRFRMEWPAHAEPSWHTDLLIAEQVVKPALDRHGRDIALWRFHRRAARDEAGHQFSFIFFASVGTARDIFSEINANPVLEMARNSGRIVAVVYDDPAHPSGPGIAGTSDSAWSTPLQQAWPYYLMGASRMWLELVSQFAREEPSAGSAPGFDRIDERYAGASAAITTLWQNEGRHAFLHHLNALFGYEPILIIDRRYMRF